MTHSRQAELRQMLEARRRDVEEQIHKHIRTFRDVGAADAAHPPASSEEHPAAEDLSFALVEIRTQMLENIKTALMRLDTGEYGICDDCDEEISKSRLRALPFATKCLTCQESAEQLAYRDRRNEQRRPPFAFLGSS